MRECGKEVHDNLLVCPHCGALFQNDEGPEFLNVYMLKVGGATKEGIGGG